MPQRYIKNLPAIQLTDANGDAVNGPNDKPITWDLSTVISAVEMNPKWSESYALMRSQAAIHDAFEDAKKAGAEYVVLAEDDWANLKSAIESPRMYIPAMNQTISGFGLLPSVNRQILPLLAAIMTAPDSKP